MGNVTAMAAAVARAGARGLTRPRWQALGALLGALFAGGCSLDGVLKNNEIPPGVTDPAITKTPAGALAAYRGTLVLFRNAFGGGPGVDNAIVATGLLSDELSDNGPPAFIVGSGFDLRILPEDAGRSGIIYSSLQQVRGQASQAIGLLNAYVPEQPARAGEMYALAGYAEVMLAELFCSGIPLSTLDYNGDYTYRPGSTTDDVFAHAQVLFDTALTLAGDSVRVAYLARVGQARALLARNQYAAAANIVAPVPTDYHYDVSFLPTTGNIAANFATTSEHTLAGDWAVSLADHEGINGLDYLSSHDPRTVDTTGGSGATAYRYPKRYAPDGSTSIVLASGIEARLTEAEAELQADGAGGTWLATLNTLRTDGTQDGVGTYNSGTGGVAGLAPLSDPGASLVGAAADSARVDLLFRERAFWLFLTAHRQGDLRRLIRQYHRSQSEVYPIGPYRSGSYTYGSDVTARIPQAERVSNPRFTGCGSTGA